MQDHTTEGVAGVDAAVEAPMLWSPAGIALWSMVFTPAFGAWLQMYNYRRLGDHERAATSWRWCMAGLAVLGWNAVGSALGQRIGLGTPLFGWLNLALLVAWLGATWPAHARIVCDKWGDGYRRRRWDSVVVLGLIAGWGYLGASSLLRWLLVSLT